MFDVFDKSYDDSVKLKRTEMDPFRLGVREWARERARKRARESLWLNILSEPEWAWVSLSEPEWAWESLSAWAEPELDN